MARRIKQLVFSSTDMNYLLQNDIFQKYAPIINLGLQAPAGLKFYLNHNLFAPLFINNSGIFEIDLEKTFSLIESIQFDEQSLKKLLQKNLLIIDILYEGEG